METSKEPRLLYWRILLVGWGTVVGTGLFISVVFAVLGSELKMLPILGMYSVAFGAIISLVLAIPMSVIWVSVFAIVRKKDLTVRRAAILTTTVIAAVGNLVFTMIFGLLTSDVLTAFTYILPWTPVAMGIAACLAWYAFQSEETLGTP